MSPDYTADSLLRLAKQFHAKKQLGQHFLVDPDQLERIAAALTLTPQDNVLEIGPGLGFLTAYLAASGAEVTAVELDAAVLAQLEQEQIGNVHLVHGDFLAYDLCQLTGHLSSGSKLKVAGNVPYQITSKIIAHLFGELDKPSPWVGEIDRVVLTVQLEVARRFIAAPGTEDYSQISILVNYYSIPTLIDVVPAGSFFPVPQVDSAVVAFDVRRAPAVTCQNMRLFRQLVQAGFRSRRKMFRNNLSFLSLTQDEVSAVFRNLQMDPQIRAERLSLEQFARLCDAFSSLIGDRQCSVETQHKVSHSA